MSRQWRSPTSKGTRILKDCLSCAIYKALAVFIVGVRGISLCFVYVKTAGTEYLLANAAIAEPLES